MKDGHLLLRDTRGNFYLGIRLPTKDYQPRDNYKDRHLLCLKHWRKRNMEHLQQYGKQYYLDHKKESHAYYLKNKKKLLAQCKCSRERKKRYRHNNNK